MNARAKSGKTDHSAFRRVAQEVAQGADLGAHGLGKENDGAFGGIVGGLGVEAETPDPKGGLQ